MRKFASMIFGVAIAAASISAARADTLGRFPFLMKGWETAATASRQAPAAIETATTARHGGIVKRGKALAYNSGARESVRAIIARHAAANGVPFKLADAVVRIESRYNPRVANGGAVGLMQIKPRTARGVGFRGSAHALYNPETNIAYGMRYLAIAYRMSHGDVCGAVMRYQSGTATRHMNAANRAYCSKARAIIASN